MLIASGQNKHVIYQCCSMRLPFDVFVFQLYPLEPLSFLFGTVCTFACAVSSRFKTSFLCGRADA